MIDTVLVILAIICFVAEAFEIKARVSPGWIGLALWAATALT